MIQRNRCNRTNPDRTTTNYIQPYKKTSCSKFKSISYIRRKCILNPWNKIQIRKSNGLNSKSKPYSDVNKVSSYRLAQMIVISIIGWYVIDHDAKVSIRFDCGSMLVLISNSRLRRLSVKQPHVAALITYVRNFRFQFGIASCSLCAVTYIISSCYFKIITQRIKYLGGDIKFLQYW